MTKEQKIKLIASIAGVILAMTLGSIFFVPIINNTPKKIAAPTTTKVVKVNYDSLMSILLTDTSSTFRQTFDSLVQKKMNPPKISNTKNQKK